MNGFAPKIRYLQSTLRSECAVANRPTSGQKTQRERGEGTPSPVEDLTVAVGTVALPDAGNQSLD